MKMQIIEPVNIAKAKSTVAEAARIYFSRDSSGSYRVDRRRARPICLLGPAGIGKTEVVRQVAEESGLAFLSYSITHHTRQSMIGLPRLAEATVDGERVSVTEYTMSDIIAEVHRTMSESGKSEGILFLDEFNCASESLRPVMLQLLQEKRFGPHAIPDGWMLVLAGNPPEYNRAATDVDPVTADRMRMVHIEPDYAAWRDYAQGRGVHPMILSYLDNHREHFYVCRRDSAGTALVTARGWEDLSVMLGCMEGEGVYPDLALVAQYIQAGDVAREFYGYCMQYASLLASGLPERIMSRDPLAAGVVESLSFERSWTLVSALLNRLRSLAADAVERDAVTETVHRELKSLAKTYGGETPEKTSNLALSEELLLRAEPQMNRAARHFLVDCALRVSRNGDWDTVRGKFRAELREPRAEAFRAAETAVANTIEVCRDALAGKPHLEFLFNGIAEDEKLLRIIAESDSDEFRALLADVACDVNAEASALESEAAEELRSAKKRARRAV